MENNILNAFGYARKSPDDKINTESSIVNQVKLIENYCKSQEWNLEDIFIDKNVSGSERNRKQFQKMLRLLDERNIKIIIVKDQDRFARDTSFFLNTLEDLNAKDIKVFSIGKNGFLSDEDLGDVVTSVVDRQYIITQKKKARILQDQKMGEGLPSIPPPYGYKYNKQKKWVVDKRKALIVQKIAISLVQGVNFRLIMKELKINKSLYYRVVNNIKRGIYNGDVIYNKKFKDSNGNIVRTEEVKYKGKHTPIIFKDEN